MFEPENINVSFFQTRNFKIVRKSYENRTKVLQKSYENGVFDKYARGGLAFKSGNLRTSIHDSLDYFIRIVTSASAHHFSRHRTPALNLTGLQFEKSYEIVRNRTKSESKFSKINIEKS